jgi:hypothetical protein
MERHMQGEFADMPSEGYGRSRTVVTNSFRGDDGKMHTRKYEGCTMHEGQMLESRHAFTDSNSGKERLALERQIDGRGRKSVRERGGDTDGGESTQNFFRNMEEHEADEFDRLWHDSKKALTGREDGDSNQQNFQQMQDRRMDDRTLLITDRPRHHHHHTTGGQQNISGQQWGEAKQQGGWDSSRQGKENIGGQQGISSGQQGIGGIGSGQQGGGYSGQQQSGQQQSGQQQTGFGGGQQGGGSGMPQVQRQQIVGGEQYVIPSKAMGQQGGQQSSSRQRGVGA